VIKNPEHVLSDTAFLKQIGKPANGPPSKLQIPEPLIVLVCLIRSGPGLLGWLWLPPQSGLFARFSICLEKAVQHCELAELYEHMQVLITSLLLCLCLTNNKPWSCGSESKSGRWRIHRIRQVCRRAGI